MFPARYFAPVYFAGSYFSKIGADAISIAFGTLNTVRAIQPLNYASNVIAPFDYRALKQI